LDPGTRPAHTAEQQFQVLVENALMTEHGEQREVFLGRVRAALGHTQTIVPDEPPAVDEALVRLATHDDDLITMFCDRAASVGMHVDRITADELVDQIVAKLVELDAKWIVVGFDSLDQADALNNAIEAADIQIVNWLAGGATMDVQFDTDVGVTDVHAALAETGSLICNVDAKHSRGLSLIPPVHIAIVGARQILPDMLDYFATQHDATGIALPSSQAIISGPSKTADIEGQLVTGVHGPGKVFVYVVEDV
jgi:L-lactate dehydrogenase complex protein LldG